MSDDIRPCVVVQCADTKRDFACAAKDLYVSTLFKWSRRWAETFGDEWRIVSARHGLLHPEEPVAPYDYTLSRMTRYERADWKTNVACATYTWLAGRPLVVLATSGYDSAFKKDRLCARFPFEGLRGFGRKIAWARDAVSAREHVEPAPQMTMEWD